MIIYPAIDIKDKSCVRLRQGSYDDVTVYERDPVRSCQDMGVHGGGNSPYSRFRWGKGRIDKQDVIRRIIENVDIPVQVGGGIRDTAGVEIYLNIGASHVIIGTAAIKNPPWLREMIDSYGDKIIVSIDARDGWIATDGWESISKKKASDYIKELKAYGLQRIVYTDIAKDGMLLGPNFKIYEELKDRVDIEVIASGGVTSIDDIRRLRELGLYGAIIGKALYDGKLDLREVLR